MHWPQARWIKKKTDEPRPVRFRALTPIPVKTLAPTTQGATSPVSTAATTSPPTTETLVKEPAPAPLYKPPAPQAPTVGKTEGKIAALHKLRQKIAEDHVKNAPPQQAIDEEKLQIAWKEYIIKLNATGKNSVASNFEMMRCTKRNDHQFMVTVTTNLQQRFLEQEKMHLVEHMQTFFHNKQITLHITLDEDTTREPVTDRPLSSKDQYMRMIEKYPLVKELKDRLHLDLIY